MKIWVIGRNYPTKKNKMCGSFELEQAQMLARQGHNVVYIACPFHPVYKIKKWGAVDWQDDGLHVYAYSQLFFPQRMNVHLDSFKRAVWKRLLEKVEKEEGVPDVIHLHYPTLISVPEPILSYQGKGSRIIITEHWTKVLTKHITENALKQLKVYVENANCFICVGVPLKRSVEELTGTKKEIYVVPNVVPNVFSKDRKQHDGFRYIAVGRLEKVKQFDKMITAFINAFRGNKEVSLTIIGSGSQSKMLNEQIKKSGMTGQICLAGTKTREEVAAIMAESDALITYSSLETFGVPVIEAWYSGIPSIATTAIGFAEYWNNSLGELISHNDISDLEKAMRLVKQRVGENYYSYDQIRQYAKEHFSEQAIYHQLMDIYTMQESDQ